MSMRGGWDGSSWCRKTVSEKLNSRAILCFVSGERLWLGSTLTTASWLPASLYFVVSMSDMRGMGRWWVILRLTCPW